MDNSIDKIWTIISGIEGGYVYNPKDPGGETNFGITARSYPNIDIKALTNAEAKDIFFKDYFTPSGCDWWLSISRPDIALMVSAFAFNASTKSAIKVLQRTMNSMNSTILVPFLVVDGVLGDKTLSKLELLKEPILTDQSIDKKIIAQILTYYTSTQNFGTFGKGWINRISNLIYAL